MGNQKEKVVAYLRISTDMQDIDSQRAALEEYASNNNYEIVNYFKDENISGSVKITERKGIKEMLEFCKDNYIHIILVYDLTRLGRYDPLDLLNDIKNICKEYNVIFEFVNEPIISDPMFNKLWNFIKSWFAEFERLQISNRTKYGLLKLKKEGRLYHRPSLLHYYASIIFNKDLKEINEEDLFKAKEMLKKIVDKYLSFGVKKTQIPRVLMDNELKGIYVNYPKAPKSEISIYMFLKKNKIL